MVKVAQILAIPTTNLHPQPKCKTIDLSAILNKAPKLSLEQAGHLRHFYNLSSTLPGESLHMGSQEPGQDFLDAKPWTREEVEGRPWVDKVGFEMGVDVSRGSWVVDEEVEAMVVTVRTCDGCERKITPILQNLPPGRYDVYIKGQHVGPKTVDAASCTMDLDIHVSGSETDVIVLKN